MRTRRKRIASAVAALVILVAAVIWFRPVSVFDWVNEMHMFLSGGRSHFATVSGYRIHYYEMGPAAGPVVVLVHGLGGRSEDWRNLAPCLAHAGYRVYIPDLPGYGRSERPVNFSYSVPDEAAIVVAFFDKMGLKQVDLGGWSMGGWIVQWAATHQPERVKKLMLFDSAGLSDRPTWNTALFTPTSSVQLAQLDDLLMPNPPHLPGFISRDILRISENHAWVIHRALDSMMTGRSVTDSLLPELKMPVLIVWGTEDHITPLAEGEKMHNLVPQSQLVSIAGCGHLAPVQCADAMGNGVVNFLRQ
jgi:pimeloyl-ACP methyl ester carboxylesterase